MESQHVHFYHRVLTLAEEAGHITSETADAMRGVHRFYPPLPATQPIPTDPSTHDTAMFESTHSMGLGGSAQMLHARVQEQLDKYLSMATEDERLVELEMLYAMILYDLIELHGEDPKVQEVTTYVGELSCACMMYHSALCACVGGA